MELRPGQTIALEITDLNSDGDGVGRSSGLVLFVRGAVPGDRIEAEVTEIGRNLGRAELRSLSLPAATRREPICLDQSLCGGCPLMVLDEAQALAVKTQHLVETLRRIGKLELDTVPMTASPEPLEYRGRVRFVVAPRAEGAAVGFHLRGRSAEMVAVERCHLAPPRATELAVDLLARLDRSLPAGSASWPRSIEMRFSRYEQRWLAVLHGAAVSGEARASCDEAITSHRDLAGIVQIGSDRPGASAVAVAGRESLIEKLESFEVEVGGTGFLQVNLPLAAEMYRYLRAEVAALTSHPRLALDLFCGAGLAGLFAVDDSTKLLGIDLSRASIAAARRTAKVAGRERARFEVEEAHAVLRELAGRGRSLDLLLMNPPRAGLGEDLSAAVAALRPQALAMISCHPAALARDLGRLQNSGMVLHSIRAFDMFPQTAELEAVAMLVTDAR